MPKKIHRSIFFNPLQIVTTILKQHFPVNPMGSHSCLPFFNPIGIEVDL